MKCKKLFALLLSLCMIVSTFVTVSSATPLTITVGDAEAAAGDTITIPVSLSNNTLVNNLGNDLQCLKTFIALWVCSLVVFYILGVSTNQNLYYGVKYIPRAVLEKGGKGQMFVDKYLQNKSGDTVKMSPLIFVSRTLWKKIRAVRTICANAIQY